MLKTLQVKEGGALFKRDYSAFDLKAFAYLSFESINLKNDKAIGFLLDMQVFHINGKSLLVPQKVTKIHVEDF